MNFDEWIIGELDRGLSKLEVDQMRAAWIAATNAERETCANVCEAASDSYAVQWDENGDREAHAASQAAQSCADSIRMRSNA